MHKLMQQRPRLPLDRPLSTSYKPVVLDHGAPILFWLLRQNEKIRAQENPIRLIFVVSGHTRKFLAHGGHISVFPVIANDSCLTRLGDASDLR